MKALKIIDTARVQIVDLPDPTPRGEDVVVRIEAAPMCGSDLHAHYGTPGGRPFVIGHEAAGVVVAVDRPRSARVGDRVAIMPFVTCGRCENCRKGFVAYCSAKTGVYGFGLDGFQAELVRVAESCLLPLPDDVGFDLGSLILDPIGTPFHALRRIGANSTHTVGIFGLGPMGLGGVINARHLAARVIAIDPIAYRRELARELGAAITVDPSAGNVVEQVRQLTGGHGLDIALECSGRPEALSAALDLLRTFGHLGLIGESNSAAIQPSRQLIHKEASISGNCGFPLGEYPAILRAIAADLGAAAKRLITHRFHLAQGDEAYRTFAAGNTGKVIFEPEGTK